KLYTRGIDARRLFTNEHLCKTDPLLTALHSNSWKFYKRPKGNSKCSTRDRFLRTAARDKVHCSCLGLQRAATPSHPAKRNFVFPIIVRYTQDLTMSKTMEILDGNQAAASVAYRLSEVIAIYPIT